MQPMQVLKQAELHLETRKYLQSLYRREKIQVAAVSVIVTILIVYQNTKNNVLVANVNALKNNGVVHHFIM